MVKKKTKKKPIRIKKAKKTKKVEKKAVKPKFGIENELIKKIKQGDESATEELIYKYTPLIATVARKYHNLFHNIEILELIAEGNRGLLEAINHFDTSRKVKLSTYSWFWITKNIHEYVTSTISFIGIPNEVLANMKKLTKIINEEMKVGNDISLEDIASQIDISLDKVKNLLINKRMLTKPVSLDKFLVEDNQEETLADLIEDKKSRPIYELFDKITEKEKIGQLLGNLEPLEAEVVKWRFGFFDNKFHTLKEISDELNVSPSKIRDLETVAIIKLKKLLSETE